MAQGPPPTVRGPRATKKKIGYLIVIYIGNQITDICQVPNPTLNGRYRGTAGIETREWKRTEPPSAFGTGPPKGLIRHCFHRSYTGTERSLTWSKPWCFRLLPLILNTLHQMRHFGTKMHRNALGRRTPPGPAGELQRSPDILAGAKGRGKWGDSGEGGKGRKTQKRKG